MDPLESAVMRLAEAAEHRVSNRQAGVLSFHDLYLRAVVAQLGARPEETLRRLDGDRHRLLQLDDQVECGRFVTPDARQAFRFDLPADRLGNIHPSSDIPAEVMRLSQGVRNVIHYQGLPLFKSVYDFALYPLILAELRPSTVVEVGSGAGASAVWLADVVSSLGLDGSVVYSFDVLPPSVVHPSVRFLRGDAALPSSITTQLPNPLTPPVLVIEDAHVNVAQLLLALHQLLSPGDYLVVEDTSIKAKAMSSFLRGARGCYEIDTYFTDFFGRNATCAVDGIFVRTHADRTVAALVR